MRIKKFIASDMNKLITQVKKELGYEAVIVSTSELPDGNIELIAAIENDDINFNEKEEIEIISSGYNDTRIRECLSYQELTSKAQADILSYCRQVARREHLNDDKEILKKTFDETFTYYNFFNNDNSVKMFMGIPGSGKSTAIAKVATIAKMKNISTAIISTDGFKAGANHQLKAFADILLSDFAVVKEADRLYDKILLAQSSHRLVLIDTPGINPFIGKEADRLAIISEKISCDKILTIDMGRNAYEAIEIAEIFADLGANCLLPTKLDLTRRIGAMLSIAENCGFKLGYTTVGSSIAKGLARVTSQSLTRLILD